MKQHPVPQNIASYQFRLVGDMTLKQFLELASGVVTAYIIFYLHLPAFIKWPIMVFFAFLGIALAFLPIQERPLDRWILNFIKSVYSPTKYLWQKNNQAPDFLTNPPKLVRKTKITSAEKLLVKTKLKTYLETLPRQTTVNPYDQQEAQRLNQINKLWQSFGAPLPNIKNNSQPIISTAPVVTPAVIAPLPKTTPMVQAAPPLAPPMAVDTLFPVKQKIKPEVAARFTSDVAFPTMPEAPNLIVGMCLDPMARILPNTLIEIIDSQGNIVRALKTNKIGQFFTAGPLENGNYKIKVEHENYRFDTIILKVEGKIIPPLKIQAKPEKTNFEY